MGALGLALAFAQLLPQLAEMAKQIIDAIDDKHPAASAGDAMVAHLKFAAQTAQEVADKAGKP